MHEQHHETQTEIDEEHARAWERANREDVRIRIDHATATDGTGRVLVIDNDDGLRMVLDALTRYLADKPLETLRTVATTLKTLPHSPYLTVSLGTQGKEGIELLRPLGARSRTFHDSEDRPLTYAILEVDGVEFTATYTEKP